MTDDARVPMLDAAAALEAGERAGVPAQLAELSIFRVLLRRERLAKATSDLLLALLFGGCLDPRLRELVIMRIGWRIGDATMVTLRSHLEEDAVLELVAAIGTWSMISTVLRSLDVPLEEGVAAWPPDSVAPG